jgi:hypothetical protein
MPFERFRHLSLLLILPAVAGLQAQNTTQSPYSNFGIGELGGGEFAQFNGLGGISQAVSGAYRYSPLNPASMGGIRYALVDFGFQGTTGRIEAGDKKRDVTTGGFSYISVAMPTMNRRVIVGQRKDSIGNLVPRLMRLQMATQFGLAPVSAVGFNYSLSDTVNLNHTVFHTGGGGINRAYFGHAIQVAGNFSLGYQASYLFGQLRDFSLFDLRDTGYFVRFEDQRNIDIQGWQHRVGFSWSPMTGKWRHTIGGSLTWHGNTTGSQSRMVRTYSSGFGGFPTYRDTVLFTQSQKGAVNLPDGFAAGYTIERPGVLRLSGEYRQENWEQFSAFYTGNRFANRETVAFGLSLRPDAAPRKMRNRNRAPIEWRFGYRSVQTQNQFIGTGGPIAVRETAYTLGAGIPISRRYFDNSIIRSQLHLNLEYIERGNMESGLARERYLRLKLGVTLGDVWFDRNKYN